MSRPNAALSLPLGDRDELPPVAPSPEAAPVAGREPDAAAQAAAATGGGNPELSAQLAAIAATIEEAQLPLAEARMAFSRADLPALEAAVWRLSEVLMLDLRRLSHDLRRAVTRARRGERAKEAA